MKELGIFFKDKSVLCCLIYKTEIYKIGKFPKLNFFGEKEKNSQTVKCMYRAEAKKL